MDEGTEVTAPRPVELSLVVATRDRAGRLRGTLDRIAAVRTRRSWELVVVDNGSRDHTAEVVQTFARSAPMPVRRVHEARPGLGRALNAGVRAAAGEIVATTDDDCYPTESYVDDVLEIFDARDVAFIGGRVLLYDSADAPVSLFEREAEEILPPHSFPYTGFIGGANLAFRREVFEDVGGFDDLLGAGTPFPAEDIDFCARASDRGWTGGYFPGPTVYHHHGRRPGREADDLKEAYDRGRGAYYAKTLLSCSSLRVRCLKWWYWSLSSARPGQTRREVLAALRFLLHRAGGRLRSLVGRSG